MISYSSNTPTTAEVRSLAVDPEVKNQGLGRILVDALEAEARENGLHAIFAFTYVPGFFNKLGFIEVDRGSLPLKAWKDCLRCPKFQCCDEIAVIRVLHPERWVPSPQTGAQIPLYEGIKGAILPIIRK